MALNFNNINTLFAKLMFVHHALFYLTIIYSGNNIQLHNLSNFKVLIYEQIGYPIKLSGAEEVVLKFHNFHHFFKMCSFLLIFNFFCLKLFKIIFAH